MNAESLASQLAAGGLTGAPAFGLAFLGGLVAGFGPCILPVLPAVFGYVTGTVSRGTSEGRPATPMWRGLALSAVFVFGMSLVSAVIGGAAGFAGRALLLGSWAYYVLALVCAVVGLQMFGVVDLPFDRLNVILPMKRPRRTGIVGALVLGMLFGLVASPCSTPVLAAIAAAAATTGSAGKGAGMLFVYGLGKGVPLLLLGLASGSLGFMRAVSVAVPALTRLGGAALIAAAAYLAWIA